VRALVAAGVSVFAQFGLTPQTAIKYGIPYSAQNAPAAQATAEAAERLVAEAKLLEDSGAALLDFTNSGPLAGAAVVKAVRIPVIGGFGGGPWLDGRVRLAHTAIGYAEKWLDAKADTYFNTAKGALEAFGALIADARAGRQIKG
jgi:3-methyl-2-oxobutanoate hydroxymethyltransferase